jgi:hypothetical protein
MSRGRLSSRALPIFLSVATVAVTACSAGTAVTPTAPSAAKVAPPQPAGVTAGMQIGTAPAAPSGWAPPAKIAPVDPLPGMFKSVGESPPQPDAKVRVFFLGMQW